METKAAMERAWDMRVNLMRVAWSILRHTADAEDAVSAAMLTAGRAAASLRDESHFNTWLMRILVRACYDTLRRRKREIPTEETREVTPFDDSGGALWTAMQALPDIYRRILVLYYYENFKAREIAVVLGIPLGTVLGRLARARTKLKQLWTAEVADHEEQGI